MSSESKLSFINGLIAGAGVVLALMSYGLLQFIAGLLVVFRPTAGVTTLTFLILIAITGASVEILGVQYSSTWGVTNIFGIMVSAILVPVAIFMYRNINEMKDI